MSLEYHINVLFFFLNLLRPQLFKVLSSGCPLSTPHPSSSLASLTDSPRRTWSPTPPGRLANPGSASGRRTSSRPRPRPRPRPRRRATRGGSPPRRGLSARGATWVERGPGRPSRGGRSGGGGGGGGPPHLPCAATGTRTVPPCGAGGAAVSWASLPVQTSGFSPPSRWSSSSSSSWPKSTAWSWTWQWPWTSLQEFFYFFTVTGTLTTATSSSSSSTSNKILRCFCFFTCQIAHTLLFLVDDWLFSFSSPFLFFFFFLAGLPGRRRRRRRRKAQP